MKDRQREGPQPTLHDHVAHLADRGEPERLLDVVLGQHHGGAEDGGEHADDERDVQGCRARSVLRSEAVDQEATRVDDAGMQQRMDGGRSVERARKPDVKRKLC